MLATKLKSAFETIKVDKKHLATYGKESVESETPVKKKTSKKKSSK